MQMPTQERQLSQTNNSSVKLFWATQAQANRSTSPRSADRSQSLQGEKSGIWSGVMGLWYARQHANGISLDLKTSKGLSAALCFKKLIACLLLGRKERNANTNAREAAGNK